MQKRKTRLIIISRFLKDEYFVKLKNKTRFRVILHLHCLLPDLMYVYVVFLPLVRNGNVSSHENERKDTSIITANPCI